MCLGIPGKVIEVKDQAATVDFWGARREILLTAVDEPVHPGDYVLVHVGFAICRIPEGEISQTLSFYNTLVTGAGLDLMTQDIAGEMAATQPE